MTLHAELEDHIDGEVQQLLDVFSSKRLAAGALLDQEDELFERKLRATGMDAGDGPRMARVDIAQVVERLLAAQLGQQDPVMSFASR